jgi:hypothetical protein
MDILCFEKDGVVYAKGFFNQEGLIFYVLSGHQRDLFEVLENVICSDACYDIQEVTSLPGGANIAA